MTLCKKLDKNKTSTKNLLHQGNQRKKEIDNNKGNLYPVKSK